MNAELLKCLDAWYQSQFPGGKGEGLKPSDVNLRQLLMGMYVELEHTPDPMLAAQISMDHLAEDPNYYDALRQVHKERVDEWGVPV